MTNTNTVETILATELSEGAWEAASEFERAILTDWATRQVALRAPTSPESIRRLADKRDLAALSSLDAVFLRAAFAELQKEWSRLTGKPAADFARVAKTHTKNRVFAGKDLSPALWTLLAAETVASAKAAVAMRSDRLFF